MLLAVEKEVKKGVEKEVEGKVGKEVEKEVEMKVLAGQRMEVLFLRISSKDLQPLLPYPRAEVQGPNP